MPSCSSARGSAPAGSRCNYSQLVEPEVLKLVQSAELARFGSMLVVFVGALIVLVMVTNTLSKADSARARSTSPTASWARASA